MPGQVGGNFWQYEECMTRVGNLVLFVAWWWLFVCFDQVDLVHRRRVGGIAVVRVVLCTFEGCYCVDGMVMFFVCH